MVCHFEKKIALHLEQKSFERITANNQVDLCYGTVEMT